jgi:hypothetical protein
MICNDSPISLLANIVAQVVAIFSVRSPPVFYMFW